MKLICAFLTHLWLALRLKHDGTGLPVRFMGAFLLALVYSALVILNKQMQNELEIGSILALCFIAQLYLFSLRNTLIGLIIVIGIVVNLFAVGISMLSEMSPLQTSLLAIMEYIMVFAALINVIKKHVKLPNNE